MKRQYDEDDTDPTKKLKDSKNFQLPYDLLGNNSTINNTNAQAYPTNGYSNQFSMTLPNNTTNHPNLPLNNNNNSYNLSKLMQNPSMIRDYSQLSNATTMSDPYFGYGDSISPQHSHGPAHGPHHTEVMSYPYPRDMVSMSSGLYGQQQSITPDVNGYRPSNDEYRRALQAYYQQYSQLANMFPVFSQPRDDFSLCGACSNPIDPKSKYYSIQGMYFHDTCVPPTKVFCTLCKIPLQEGNLLIDNRPYCQTHFDMIKSQTTKEHDESADEKELDELNGYIETQPACYQIANYNVHPAPTLCLEKTITGSVNVGVTLVEASSHIEVSTGFQAGQQRKIRPGGKFVYFTGLKINKMNKIKNDLQRHNLKKVDTFYLKFTIGSKSWNTDCFKLVSSCTQLPENLREAVRPPKKTKNNDSPTED